jgi:tetratricopeptide (TPR) repeat protein
MMHWTRSAVFVCLVALVMISCGPAGPSEMEQEQEAEWISLQEAKQVLDEQRQKLVEMRQMVAEAPEETEAEEGAEGVVEAEPMPTAADVEALENEIASSAEDFGGRLVSFLNNDPMIEGEPPSERQLAALHMKSGEDIALAQEWIDKGGDYKRAIDIYNNALRFDPGNEAVEQALAVANANRYMSKERFEAAKKGMNEAEVRAALGQVNLHNVKPFPERKVVAWFYPTADDGSAAAVWFREEKDGSNKVYRLNFEEVKPKDQQETG